MYDSENEQFLDETITAINAHTKEESDKKHIEVVSSVPNDLTETGILFKVDGTQSDVPSMITVDEINKNITQKIQAANLAYKESYTTLAALQAVYPTGNQYNHVVLTDGMIYTWSNNAWVNTQIQANGTGIANLSVKTNHLSSNLQNFLEKFKKTASVTQTYTVSFESLTPSKRAWHGLATPIKDVSSFSKIGIVFSLDNTSSNHTYTCEIRDYNDFNKILYTSTGIKNNTGKQNVVFDFGTDIEQGNFYVALYTNDGQLTYIINNISSSVDLNKQKYHITTSSGSWALMSSSYGDYAVPMIFYTDDLSEGVKAIEDEIKSVKNGLNYSDFDTTLIADENNTVLNTGYLTSTDTVAQATQTDKYTDYIVIEPNTKYRYEGRFNDARCVLILDEDKNVLSYHSGYSVSNSSLLEFTSSGSAKCFRASAQGGEFKLYKIAYSLKEKIQELDNILVGSNDFQANPPKYLFALDNDSGNFYSREYTQSLFVESLVNSKIPIGVEGKREHSLQTLAKNTNTKETTDINVSYGGNGYIEKSATVKLVKTKTSNAKNKTIRYLAIGDSITAYNASLLDGTLKGGGNYQSIAKEISMMDNMDFGDNSINMLLVGTRRTGNTSANTDYKGQSLNVRAFAEGRGSWATVSYLRHTILTIPGSATTTTLGGKAAWDSLGLGRKIAIDGTYNESAAYEAFTNTTAQKRLIALTPHGKYHWDYSGELLNWLLARKSLATQTYTGSSAQKSLIDQYMNELLDNPVNVFFDKNVAKTTSDYAFSMTTYLNRYKTLSDTDGSTRLVAGSTSGSMVTNANSYDVCTPTHITIELGENDRWHFSAGALSETDVKNDLLKMITVINNQLPNTKVGFMTTRSVGCLYPERWTDIAIAKEIPVSSNVFKYNLNKLMQDELGNLSATRNFYIPTYYVQCPFSSLDSRLDKNVSTGKEIIVTGTDTIHPGYQSYWAMGYQTLAWIYYTL